MTPLEYVTIRTPQFATDPRINQLIVVADELTGTVFGDRRNYAIALRVMHWKTREALQGGTSDGSSSGTGQAGTIQSESEGQLSRSYGIGASSGQYGDLETTAYGQELIELMNGCIMTARTRMME